MYDVIIIGAGLSGSTAAAMLARSGRSIAVVEKNDAPKPHITWASGQTHTLLEPLDLSADNVLGQPLGTLSLLNGDLTRRANCDLTGPSAYLIDRTALAKSLMAGAVEAGAALHAPETAIHLDLAEDHVAVTTQSGKTIQARLLIAADGVQSILPQHQGWPGFSRLYHRYQLDIACTGKQLAGLTDRAPAAAFAFDCPAPGAAAFVLIRKQGLTAALIARTTQQEAAAQFARFYRLACQANLIPMDLPIDPAIAHSRAVPTGAALTLETHVGKRALLIGSAGGFVAAMSHQAVYPAIWSATLAVDVIAAALDSPTPQDALGRFDTLWRTAMAGYLLPPSTDLKFLLPLAFTNRKMADRLASALLTGSDV